MFTLRMPSPGRHTLVWLALALIPAFTTTALISRGYHKEQRELARDWHARGDAALRRQEPGAAIDAYRTALMYSREDRVLRLHLAEALMAAGRTSEARAHLLTLWTNQPGNGPVNLELARLAAADRDLPSAIRHYHNAIEGAWPEEPETRRRNARLELARLLVDQKATPQAQAELIALAADPPADRAQRKQVAALLLAADLPQRALPMYQQLLTAEPQDAEAAAGAGRAAFTMHNGPLARRYLAEALRRGSPAPDVASLLEVVRLEGELDPFARRLSRRERLRRTSRALDAAQARLQCVPADDPGVAALRAEVAGAAASIGSRQAADTETTDDVMDMVLRVEEATEARCAAPAPIDRALRRIAERRQGSGG